MTILHVSWVTALGGGWRTAPIDFGDPTPAPVDWEAVVGRVRAALGIPDRSPVIVRESTPPPARRWTTDPAARGPLWRTDYWAPGQPTFGAVVGR